MRTPAHVGLLVIMLVTASSSRLAGQTLTTGTWSGSASFPDGNTTNVTYEVAQTGDSVSVVLMIPNAPPFVFEQLRFVDGVLMFDMQQIIHCSLAPVVQTGGYSGQCVQEGDGTGALTMIPPTKK